MSQLEQQNKKVAYVIQELDSQSKNNEVQSYELIKLKCPFVICEDLFIYSGTSLDASKETWTCCCRT